MRVGCGGLFHGFSFGAGFELMRRVIVPVIIVAIPLILWWWLGPEKPSCDAERSQKARYAVAQVAERIRAERGTVRRAAVLHFVNDPTDFLTDTMRERLMDGGLLDLDGTPSSEKIRNLFNLRNEGTFNVDEAIEYGRDNGLDAVVIGSVDLFETVNGDAELTGQVKFVKIATGEVIDIPLSGKPLPQEQQGVQVREPGVIETTPLLTRVILMAVCIIVVPILVFPFLKLVMRRDSNMATAIVLVALLAVDGLIISIALGTSGTFCGLAVFLVSLAAAFGYDLFMLSYAQLCRPALPSA